MIKYMKAMHQFFLKESYSYMKGTNRLFYYCYYLIAYIKFMWYCYQDYRKFNTN